MKDQSLLPLGSVIYLKDQEKKLMIIGYLPFDVEDHTKIYDYLGCLYPEGVLTTDKNILFDHADIKKIIYKGFENEDHKKLLSNLKKIRSNQNIKK